MIYFGNRQVGKTYIAINRLLKAYKNKKGKILVIAPTTGEAGFIYKLLVNKEVDKEDIITSNVLLGDNKIDGVKIEYRYIEGLDRVISDNENTFATVSRSAFIDRQDKNYIEFIREYRPDNLIYLNNSILGEKELKEREVLKLKERIAKLETEIKMME